MRKTRRLFLPGTALRAIILAGPVTSSGGMAMTQHERHEADYRGIANTEDAAARPWPPSPLPVPPYVLPQAPPAPAAPEQPPETVRPTAPSPTPKTTLHPKADLQSPSGPEIKQARERLGMTQTELARLVGRSRSFIALVEQGRRVASEEDLRKLKQVLGL